MGDEIRITYETLFDLLRREKGREELQKLDPAFLTDVEAYLTEKHSIAAGPNESFFSDEERQKTILQLTNSCKLLRELSERREKKILATALIKARDTKALVDMSAMLAQEQALFAKLTELLVQQRRDTIDPLLAIGGLAQRQLPPTHIALEPKPQPLKTVDQPNSTVEFLAEVPKFVGKSLEVYGPYSIGQQAMLPAEIARILISKGRAKEVAAQAAEQSDAVELDEAETPLQS